MDKWNSMLKKLLGKARRVRGHLCLVLWPSGQYPNDGYLLLRALLKLCWRQCPWEKQTCVLKPLTPPLWLHRSSVFLGKENAGGCGPLANGKLVFLRRTWLYIESNGLKWCVSPPPRNQKFFLFGVGTCQIAQRALGLFVYFSFA